MQVLLLAGIIALVVNLICRRWVRRWTWIGGTGSFLGSAGTIGYATYRSGHHGNDGLTGDVSYDRHTAETLSVIAVLLLVSLAVWVISLWFDWRTERLDRL